MLNVSLKKSDEVKINKFIDDGTLKQTFDRSPINIPVFSVLHNKIY